MFPTAEFITDGLDGPDDSSSQLSQGKREELRAHLMNTI